MRNTFIIGLLIILCFITASAQVPMSSISMDTWDKNTGSVPALETSLHKIDMETDKGKFWDVCFTADGYKEPWCLKSYPAGQIKYEILDDGRVKFGIDVANIHLYDDVLIEYNELPEKRGFRMDKKDLAMSGLEYKQEGLVLRVLNPGKTDGWIDPILGNLNVTIDSCYNFDLMGSVVDFEICLNASSIYSNGELSGSERNILRNGTTNLSINYDDSFIEVAMKNESGLYIFRGNESVNSSLLWDNATLSALQNYEALAGRKTVYYDVITEMIEIYLFNGLNDDVEWHPIEHNTTIYNGMGLKHEYRVSDLIYSGSLYNITERIHNFGNDISVLLGSVPDSGTVNDDTLIAIRNITPYIEYVCNETSWAADIQGYYCSQLLNISQDFYKSVDRLFDPPGTSSLYEAKFTSTNFVDGNLSGQDGFAATGGSALEVNTTAEWLLHKDASGTSIQSISPSGNIVEVQVNFSLSSDFSLNSETGNWDLLDTNDALGVRLACDAAEALMVRDTILRTLVAKGCVGYGITKLVINDTNEKYQVWHNGVLELNWTDLRGDYITTFGGIRAFTGTGYGVGGTGRTSSICVAADVDTECFTAPSVLWTTQEVLAFPTVNITSDSSIFELFANASFPLIGNRTGVGSISFTRTKLSVPGQAVEAGIRADIDDVTFYNNSNMGSSSGDGIFSKSAGLFRTNLSESLPNIVLNRKRTGGIGVLGFNNLAFSVVTDRSVHNNTVCTLLKDVDFSVVNSSFVNVFNMTFEKLINSTTALATVFTASTSVGGSRDLIGYVEDEDGNKINGMTFIGTVSSTSSRSLFSAGIDEVSRTGNATYKFFFKSSDGLNITGEDETVFIDTKDTGGRSNHFVFTSNASTNITHNLTLTAGTHEIVRVEDFPIYVGNIMGVDASVGGWSTSGNFDINFQINISGSQNFTSGLDPWTAINEVKGMGGIASGISVNASRNEVYNVSLLLIVPAGETFVLFDESFRVQEVTDLFTSQFNTPPIVAILDPVNGTTRNNTASILLTSIIDSNLDDCNVTISEGTTLSSSYDGNQSLDWGLIDRGIHNGTVTCIDNFGLVGSDDVTYIFETSADPIAAILSPVTGLTINDNNLTTNISYTHSDGDNGTLRLYVDGVNTMNSSVLISGSSYLFNFNNNTYEQHNWTADAVTSYSGASGNITGPKAVTRFATFRLIHSGLAVIGLTATSITWNWTNPTNGAFNLTNVFFDGVFNQSVDENTTSITLTGIIPVSSHNITIQPCDTFGNCGTNSTSVQTASGGLSQEEHDWLEFLYRTFKFMNAILALIAVIALFATFAVKLDEKHPALAVPLFILSMAMTTILIYVARLSVDSVDQTSSIIGRMNNIYIILGWVVGALMTYVLVYMLYKWLTKTRQDGGSLLEQLRNKRQGL